MITAALNVTLLVGTSANQDPSRASELTLESLDVLVRGFAKANNLGCTVTRALGVDGAAEEPSSIIRSDLHIDEKTAPDIVVCFCHTIHSLLMILLTEFRQNWIKVDVKLVLPHDTVEWTATTTREGLSLIDPPFVLPALIARRLATAGVVSTDGFAESTLRKTLAQHYALTLKSDITRADFAGVWSEASGELARPRDVRELLTKDEAVRGWDAAIVRACDESEIGMADEVYGKRGAFISRFQRASMRDVYYVPRLEPLLNLHAEPINVALCPYRVGAGCCEGAYLHTLEAWLTTRADSEGFASFLATERDTGHLERVTRSMIGVDVVLLTPDGLVAKQRSRTVGSYPGMWMLIPAGQVEPVSGWGTPSVFWTVIHELDEELFGGDDEHRDLEGVRCEPHIRDLVGMITYLGYGVELMNDHVMLFVLFEPAAEWWQAYKPKIARCWELEGKRPVYVDLEIPRPDLVPGVYSAIELTRRAIRRRNGSAQ